MNRQVPAIVKAAARLMLSIEEAVSFFPRRHKYLVGQDLRRLAMDLALAADRAWWDRQRQVQRVQVLSDLVDEFRLTLQKCDGLQVFRSRGQFEAVARQTTDLGRQVGGWRKRLHQMGQSAAGASRSQCAPILSSPAALAGAMP